MATYSVPSSTPRSTYGIEVFRGIDYTSEPSNVRNDMSPYAPNMVRDVPGKVRKSMGWYWFDRLPYGSINGRYKLSTEDFWLVHNGTKLLQYIPSEVGDDVVETTGTVVKGTYKVLYSEMDDMVSHAWQMTYAPFGGGTNDQCLVIQTGKTLLIYKNGVVKTAAEMAYVPTITVAKTAGAIGGGYENEAFNLLTPKYKETFIGNGTEKVFTMTFPIDTGSSVVVKTRSGSEWSVVASSGYTVNNSKGTITFTNAPADATTEGEPNVEIQASHTVQGYADRINNCTIGCLYGINGTPNRLFVSGNPDPDLWNYDWFSGHNDPTYWPDNGYGTIGGNDSKIVGYCTVGNYLATFKDGKDPYRSVVFRTGVETTSEVNGVTYYDTTFPIYNTLQGPGCVSGNSVAYLGTEPHFLTETGIFALTASDVTGDKYQQNRSYYMNGALNKEGEKGSSFAVTYNDQYVLYINNQFYILDGLQKMSTSGDPYSTRQYACFNRINVPARIMWVENDVLYFGTSDGKLCAFHKDQNTLASYVDNSRRRLDGSLLPNMKTRDDEDLVDAIPAYWETTDIYGAKFYRNKNFRYFALVQKGYMLSNVNAFAYIKDKWEDMHLTSNSTGYFNFSELVFSALHFGSGVETQTVHVKFKRKKLDRVRFRIQNTYKYEPLGLYMWGCEFVEKGYYKG